MTKVTMDPAEALLPTQKRNYERGQTGLEPLRGYPIGSDPGILYNVTRDPDLIDPHTGEHAIIATSVADERFRTK